MKTRLIKYGSCGAFVALMAYWYIDLRDFAGAALVDQYRMLCDAFTVPGILLLMTSALVALSNMGALDGLGYAMGMAIRSLIPGGRIKDETYGDYVARKREKRIKGYGFLAISGAVTMAIAVVFWMLFYTVY